MASCSFDGPNRLVILASGTTSIQVRDVYLAWKEWVSTEDNTKWLPAFSFVGGDPLVGALSLGVTFFLENGWKIRPQEANHRLAVTGNLYCRDGSSPFAPTVGKYNVLANLMTSDLVSTISTASQQQAATPDEIAQAVWNLPSSEAGAAGTVGQWVTGKILTLKQFLALT